jgi:hypothetical protein
MDQDCCLLVVLVYNFKRQETASPLFKLQTKTTSFGQLVIWCFVTLDEMKRAIIFKKYTRGLSAF